MGRCGRSRRLRRSPPSGADRVGRRQIAACVAALLVTAAGLWMAAHDPAARQRRTAGRIQYRLFPRRRQDSASGASPPSRRRCRPVIPGNGRRRAALQRSGPLGSPRRRCSPRRCRPRAWLRTMQEAGAPRSGSSSPPGGGDAVTIRFAKDTKLSRSGCRDHRNAFLRRRAGETVAALHWALVQRLVIEALLADDATDRGGADFRSLQLASRRTEACRARPRNAIPQYSPDRRSR